MKSREEYLIEFEKKLVTTLTDLQKAVDQQLIAAFTLMILLVMVVSNTATTPSLLTVTISSKAMFICFVSLVLFGVYISICYFLMRIGTVYSSINYNAHLLSQENLANSRPISIADLDLFAYGIAGLVF